LENLPSRWRLAADVCGRCSRVTFPQRGRCRNCGHTDQLRGVELPREGTVEATTTVGVGAQPTEFDRQVAAAGPYEVVIVGLAQGARATFQVSDALAGSIRIGARIRLKLRRLYPMEGQWRYGLKAVPT
jgi:hydroxymethylglutaryl-CoA synthase